MLTSAENSALPMMLPPMEIETVFSGAVCAGGRPGPPNRPPADPDRADGTPELDGGGIRSAAADDAAADRDRTEGASIAAVGDLAAVAGAAADEVSADLDRAVLVGKDEFRLVYVPGDREHADGAIEGIHQVRRAGGRALLAERMYGHGFDGGDGGG